MQLPYSSLQGQDLNSYVSSQAIATLGAHHIACH